MDLKTSRSTQWLRLLAPQALAGGAGGSALAAACLLALALIFLADKLTPPTVVVGTLSFIPVLLAVWLLSDRLAAVVTVTAILLRIAAALFAGIHPITALAEAFTIGVVAAVGRFAAVVVTAFWSARALAEERDRIARELHDGTIQSLFAIGIGLRTARNLPGGRDLERRVDDAVLGLEQVIRDLRNYVFGLRPAIVADQQLGAALEELAEELKARTRVTMQTQIDQLVAAGLAPSAGEVVQIAREALSNVGRHSLARHCRLTLRRNGDDAVLEITDDGRGFDSAELHRSGSGLGNMRKRAAALGGWVAVDAMPGHGTTVRITMPMAGRR